MYERFTDRSRKVMQLANQEAQRFNHEYIGTEHILLGLIKEGSGVGANMLKDAGLDLRTVRLEIEKIVESGPDMVTMGKLPQTPRAKNVVEYSIEEARGFNHNYVGTEHILLGLIRENEGVAHRVLVQFGLTLEKTRETLKRLVGVKTEALKTETVQVSVPCGGYVSWTVSNEGNSVTKTERVHGIVQDFQFTFNQVDALKSLKDLAPGRFIDPECKVPNPYTAELIVQQLKECKELRRKVLTMLTE